MFVNCTPHVVRIGNLELQPSGICPRVETVMQNLEPIGLVPIKKATFGSVADMPPVEAGKYYIVSQLVANHELNASRCDLFYPGELERDDKGNIIGCKSLFAGIGYSEFPF